ncbi:MAG: hypothetical protein WDN45_05480 [Caulobacteraceae bacterium]
MPDHGELGDGSLVGQERAFLLALDARALQLKTQGVAPDVAGKQIQAEFEKTYAGWQGLGEHPAVRAARLRRPAHLEARAPGGMTP